MVKPFKLKLIFFGLYYICWRMIILLECYFWSSCNLYSLFCFVKFVIKFCFKLVIHPNKENAVLRISITTIWFSTFQIPWILKIPHPNPFLSFSQELVALCDIWKSQRFFRDFCFCQEFQLDLKPFGNCKCGFLVTWVSLKGL